MQKLMCGLVLGLGGLIANPWTARAADGGSWAVTPADPLLRQFVQAVVEANPRVQAARAALEASGSYRDAASRPLYNPELDVTSERAHEARYTLGVGYTMDWAGKRKARTAVAESERMVAEAEYLAARRAVTVELLDGLARHQTSGERDSLAGSRRRLMDAFATLAQRRFDTGDLSQVELDLARLAAMEARIQKATAGAALAEVRQAVRSLAPDSPVSQWPSLPGSLPALSEGTDPRSLVTALPEVLAARRQVASADALVELRRRERRPDPTLSVAGGKEAGDLLTVVEFTIPLPVLNRFKDEVSAAAAERSQAQQIADDVSRRAHARLISAMERYNLSRGAWEDWEVTGQTSLTRQTEQLQKLWEADDLSTTDYLVQLRQTLDVQESALDLREALWRAWLEWLSASGQIDAWLGRGASRTME